MPIAYINFLWRSLSSLAISFPASGVSTSSTLQLLIAIGLLLTGSQQHSGGTMKQWVYVYSSDHSLESC